jgi:hypothetical protein
MGAPRGGASRRITQEAFDAAVAENVEEFGMGPEEALAEAVAGLQLQGVDLSNVRVTLPEEGGRPQLRAVVAAQALLDAQAGAGAGAAAEQAALAALAAQLAGPDVEPDAVQAAGAQAARARARVRVRPQRAHRGVHPLPQCFRAPQAVPAPWRRCSSRCAPSPPPATRARAACCRRWRR